MGCPKGGLGQGQEVGEPPAITPGKSQRLQWFGVAGRRGLAGAEGTTQQQQGRRRQQTGQAVAESSGVLRRSQDDRRLLLCHSLLPPVPDPAR